MKMMENIMNVFISYAKEDKETAKRLHDNLQYYGFDPWLDTEKLLPGQRWEQTIEEAIENSRFFIAILSKNSIDKVGVVQKELKKALSVLELHPENDVFLIPVRIEDCRPSSLRLAEIQWVDMFPDWKAGLERIIKVIKTYSSQEIIKLERNTSLDDRVAFFESSELGQILTKVLILFSVEETITRRQVSLQLELYGTLTRAYLELLRHQGYLSRKDSEHGTFYRLTEIGKTVVEALRGR